MPRGRQPSKNPPLTSAERSRRWRDRLKENAAAHAEYLQAERDRWQNRRQKGSVPKLVKEMTTREHRQKKKEWRKAKRRKVAMACATNHIETPPTSPDGGLLAQPEQPLQVNKRALVGKKRSKKALKKNRRMLKKLEEEVKAEKRKNAALRAQLSREKRKTNDDTPRKRAENIIKTDNRNTVKRHLTYQGVLIDEVKRQKGFDKLTIGVFRKYRGMRKWMSKNVKDVRREVGKKKRGRKLPKPVVDKVKAFWEREDVSEYTAGKKEYITRAGEKRQRRYMTASIKELHNKYNASTHFRVSYSTFKNLRPFYVLRKDARHRDSCLCQRCSNISSMARTLKRHGVIKSDSADRLRESYICMTENKVNEDCVAQACSNCPKKIDINEDLDLDKRVQWEQWAYVKVPITKAGKVSECRKLVKQAKSSTLLELADDLDTEMSMRGARHIAVYRHQQSLLQDLKSKLSQSEAVVLMDFSENYSCKYANEVQSFHFGGSREQVTIHDGVIYHASGEKWSFATISDSRRHDPIAIWCYLQPVLKQVEEKYPDLKAIHFQTDGPTTQYRSKLNLYLFSTKYASTGSTWNFSGAGHGKNAADGIGGHLKRSADALVGQGQDIPNAQIFFQKLSELESSIKLYFVPEVELLEYENNLHIPKLDPIPGTMSLHQVGIVDSGKLWYRDFGCFCMYPVHCYCYEIKEHTFQFAEASRFRSSTDQDPPAPANKSNDDGVSVNRKSPIGASAELLNRWVIVKYEYDQRVYPGIITEVAENGQEILVSVMRQKGQNAFNWPTTPDIAMYANEDIIAFIDEPQKASKRHYKFTQHDWELYQDQL